MRAGAEGAAAPAPDAHTIKLVIAAGFGSMHGRQREGGLMPRPITYYFSLLSPWAYIGQRHF